jgi:hypothetical protein
MVKRCPVLLNNEVVTVVRFDNSEVQLPPIGYKAEQINVVFENGKYKVAPDNYVEQPKIQKPKTEKTENKKTTQKVGKSKNKRRH